MNRVIFHGLHCDVNPIVVGNWRQKEYLMCHWGTINKWICVASVSVIYSALSDILNKIVGSRLVANPAGPDNQSVRTILMWYHFGRNMPAIGFQQIYEECQRAGSGNVCCCCCFYSWSNSLVLTFTWILIKAVTLRTVITLFYCLRWKHQMRSL